MRGAARSLLVAAAVLTAASSAARAQSAAPLVDAMPSITVEGEAKRDVAPDVALVTLGVVTDRGTASQASEDNARAAAALVAVARGAGLGDADIRTADLRLSAVTDARDAGKVKTYRASNQVTLRLRDLDRVGALVSQLTTGGANSIEGIAFTLSDPRPVLDDLRSQATQDAARKADLYVKAAGVKLGRVLRIAPVTDGPLPGVRAFKLQMVASAPAPPVEAGSQELEARVQITWELVP